ncbi:MAG: phosphatase PAP2 family protein [Bdellovibrionota bacterium]
MRKFFIIPGVLLLLFPALSWGEGEALSVYRLDTQTEVTVLGTSVAASVVPYALESVLIHPRCPCDPNEVNALDRPFIGLGAQAPDTISDLTLAASVAAPFVASVLEGGLSRTFLEDAVVEGEAIAVAGALDTFAKFTVQRPLPRTYAGDPSLLNSAGGYRSFYSGHTALTMAALSSAAYTLNLRHHWGAWPWIAAGVVGASVAVERVAAGRHFPTDVLVGGAVGTLVGVLMPWLHAKAPRAISAFSVRSHELGTQVIWSYRL